MPRSEPGLLVMCFYIDGSCSRHSGQIYGAYSGLFTLSLRVVLQDTLRLVYSSNTDYFAVRRFICWQSVPYRNTLKHNLSFPVTVLSVGIMCFYMSPTVNDSICPSFILGQLMHGGNTCRPVVFYCTVACHKG